MAKRPNRARIVMPSYEDDSEREAAGNSKHAAIFTGLPRMIRRHELKLVVPLADSTIHTLEKLGEFPRRFNLTPRCVVWDFEEVEAWIAQRRLSYREGQVKVASPPDLSQRKFRPIKSAEKS